VRGSVVFVEPGDALGQTGPLAAIGGALGGLGAGAIALGEPCGRQVTTDCVVNPSGIQDWFIDMPVPAAASLGGLMGAGAGFFLMLAIKGYRDWDEGRRQM
jgi:hypothetical protein